MAKTRLQIPKATRDAVLKEFNHRCAICGTDRPQVHHIDEDPSNNELLNLIPLCPNCHLVDQHNPTVPMDAEKLRLFREFKDPTILKPQFHLLFIRMKYLNSITSESKASDVEKCSKELVEFIAELEMGSFYSKSLGKLLKRDTSGVFSMYDEAANRAKYERMAKQYIEQITDVKDTVRSLIIELLRFQNWPDKNETVRK
jgi:ubiquitin